MLIPHPYFEFLIQDHYLTITFLPPSIAYPLIIEHTFLTPPSSMNILPTIQAHLPTSLVYHYTPCTYPWDEVTDYFFHKQGYNWFCYQRICVTSWQQRSRTHRPESCTMASIEILSSYLQTIMHSRSSREAGGTMVGGLDQRHSVWQNHTQARTQAKPCNTCQWLDSSQESCSSSWLATTTSYLVRFSGFEEGCRAVQRWLRRCPPSPWE